MSKPDQPCRRKFVVNSISVNVLPRSSRVKKDLHFLHFLRKYFLEKCVEDGKIRCIIIDEILFILRGDNPTTFKAATSKVTAKFLFLSFLVAFATVMACRTTPNDKKKKGGKKVIHTEAGIDLSIRRNCVHVSEGGFSALWNALYNGRGGGN